MFYNKNSQRIYGKKHSKTRFSNDVNYLITLLILLITDNPIVSTNRLFKVYVLLFVTTVFFIRRKKFDKELVYVIASVVLIVLLQGLRWGYSWFTIGTYIGLAVLIPYFAIKVVGIKYLEITSKIVYVIAIYSLLLYFAQLFIPGVTNFLYQIEFFFKQFNPLMEQPSLFFYTIAYQTIEQQGSIFGLIRNAGMFHEPGAFAVFIDLAIVINLMKEKKLFSKKNTILLVALATTFSTAGILAFLMILGIYNYVIKNNEPVKLIIISIIVIPVFIGIWQLPFVKNKIEYQFRDQTSATLTTATSGRILGARKALYVLGKYPVTGRGLTKASRVENFHSEEKAGYGFMNYFSTLGVIFSLIFIIFFIKGMKRISFYYTNATKAWLLLGGSLVINLFSQKFIADNFFTMFFFIGLLNEFSLKNLKSSLRHYVKK